MSDRNLNYVELTGTVESIVPHSHNYYVEWVLCKPYQMTEAGGKHSTKYVRVLCVGYGVIAELFIRDCVVGSHVSIRGALAVGSNGLEIIVQEMEVINE